MGEPWMPLKCFGVGCQKRTECWRFVTTPYGYDQRYLVPKLNDEGTECEDYWRMTRLEKAEMEERRKK
jgi:hypothetical protein